MNDNPVEPVSLCPRSPALALRAACRKTGYDDGGRRCFACPLKDLCESEERWLVAFRVH
jgi:hypothetical protein